MARASTRRAAQLMPRPGESAHALRIMAHNHRFDREEFSQVRSHTETSSRKGQPRLDCHPCSLYIAWPEILAAHSCFHNSPRVAARSHLLPCRPLDQHTRAGSLAQSGKRFLSQALAGIVGTQSQHQDTCSSQHGGSQCLACYSDAPACDTQRTLADLRMDRHCH